MTRPTTSQSAPRGPKFIAWLRDAGEWIERYMSLSEAVVFAIVVMVTAQLILTAPPIDSMRTYARVIYHVVGPLGLLAALVIAMVSLIQLKSSVVRFATTILVVVAAAATIRHQHADIEELAHWAIANTDQAIAAGAGALVLATVLLLSQMLGRRAATGEAGMPAAPPGRTWGPAENRPETEGITPGWSDDCAELPFRYFVTCAVLTRYGQSDETVAIARAFPISDMFDVAAIAEAYRQDLRAAHPEWDWVRVRVTQWQAFEEPLPDTEEKKRPPVDRSGNNVLVFRQLTPDRPPTRDA